MRINEIIQENSQLRESPFRGMSAKQPQPDPDIAAAKKSGTKAGILQGLDQFAGTNAFGANKAKSVVDIDKDMDRLDINAKKQLLAKLQRELGNQAAPANKTSSASAAPSTPPAAKTAPPAK